MKRIGIDFGTTNSTIAYLDNTGNFIAHKFGGLNGSEYISSSIAYLKDDISAPPRIGSDAKQSRAIPNEYYYFEHYKLKLIQKYDLMFENRKRVIDIVKDYLRQLILKYKDDVFNNDNKSEKLEYIALALPNTIFSPDVKNAHEVEAANKIKAELKEILEEQADKFNFFSESTCACHFYINRYERDFTGNIVVVDYGGGTLDITNCRIAQNTTNIPQILVTAQHGTSTTDLAEFSSYAGVQFDYEVISQLSEVPTEKHTSYANRFETYFKIPLSDMVNQELKNYYEKGRNNTLQWEANVDTFYPITPEILDDAFSKINLPKLKEYFTSVVPEEKRGSGGAAGQTDFRVLLIGGFSQLYCVEYNIRNFLKIDVGSLHDNRLAKVNANERFLAVAYGAAMEANKVISNTRTIKNLYEIGIKIFNGKMKNDIILEENGELNREDISWNDRTYYICSGEHANINLYCSTSVSGEGEPYPVNISEVCTDDCSIKLGISVINEEYKLHIKNINTNHQTNMNISGLIANYRNRRGR